MIAVASVTAIGFVFSGTAQAASLIDDNFNNENSGVAAPNTLNYDSFANWNVTDGSVDIIGNGYFDFAPGNGLYLDLDGSTGNAGRLESKTAFNFNVGDMVTLEFDILGSNGSQNNMNVSLGNFFSESFSIQDIGTVTRSFTINSAGTANLAFDHNGGDNRGLLLDNVHLSRTSQVSTPEPSALFSLIALGTMITGSTGAMKKKKTMV